MAQQPYSLAESIESIIDAFSEYAAMYGNRDTLTRKEFKELMNNEFPNFLKKETGNKPSVNDLMEDLDTNQDIHLDFSEFVVLIGRLTYAIAQ